MCGKAQERTEAPVGGLDPRSVGIEALGSSGGVQPRTRSCASEGDPGVTQGDPGVTPLHGLTVVSGCPCFCVALNQFSHILSRAAELRRLGFGMRVRAATRMLLLAAFVIK